MFGGSVPALCSRQQKLVCSKKVEETNQIIMSILFSFSFFFEGEYYISFLFPLSSFFIIFCDPLIILMIVIATYSTEQFWK